MKYADVFKEAKKHDRVVVFSSELYNKFKPEIEKAAKALGYQEKHKRAYFPKKD